MDPGITAGDVVVQADDTGSLMISTLNDLSAQMVFKHDLSYGNNGSVQSELQQIEFSDGTSIELTDSFSDPTSTTTTGLVFTTIGTIANKTLVGSGFGANAFDLGLGGDTVTFGNGDTTGSNENTVYFSKGDGTAVINTNGGLGTLVLGADISEADVVLQADEAGDLIVSLRDDPTDNVTFQNDLGTDDYDVTSRLQQIKLSDGTSIALTSGTVSDPLQANTLVFTYIGTAADTMLVGSGYGANVFDLSPGGDTVTFGTSNVGGSTQNTILFDEGDGHVNVETNYGVGTLDIGFSANADVLLQRPNILASDVIFQADDDTGALTVSLRDDPSDSITFQNDLGLSGSGVTTRLQQIELGDGTSIALASGLVADPLHANALVFTYIGTTADTNLVGSGFGANVFDLAPGGDSVIFGNGGYDGSDQNTVLFDKGDGAVTVDMNYAVGMLILGADINSADLMFQADDETSTLIVSLRDDPSDSITFQNDLGLSASGVTTRLQQIELGDGTSIALVTGSVDNPAQANPFVFTYIGNAAATTLVGSGFGANVFDLAPGGDAVTFGNGGYDASDQNTVLFNKGDGAVTVDMNYAVGMLVLGAHINAADLIFQADDDTSTLIVSLRDDPSDSITFQNDLNFDGSEVNTRLQQIKFSDGTGIALTSGSVDDPAQANPLVFTYIGTAANTTLVGSGFGANIFDLAPGGDTVTFGNGYNGGSNQNTVLFHVGDGQVIVNEGDGIGSVTLDPGISMAQLSTTIDQSGNQEVLIGDNGDEITFVGTNTPAIQVEYNGQDVSVLIGTTGDDSLVGGPTAEVFDGKGGNDYEQGNSGADTFIYNVGYGQLEVAETDVSSNLHNVLQIGAGLTAAQITASSDSSGNVYLTDGTTGDQVELDSELEGQSYGVQSVQFADGTSLTKAQLIALAIDKTGTSGADTLSGSGGNVFDGKGAPSGSQDYEQGGGGDIFIYNKGYGQLEVNETDFGSNPHDVLQIGAGLTAAQILVTSDSSGDIYLTDGTPGDQVELDSELEGQVYGVQSVQFADSTSLTKAQLSVMATTGTVGADSLYGTSGADTFDGKGAPAGSQDYEQGGGGGDTFIYDIGYGLLEINEADGGKNPNNILQLGAGIRHADVSASKASDGTDVVLTIGTGANRVTIDDMLSNSTWGFQTLKFSDGTTWTAKEVDSLAKTGTAKADTITGTTGNDVFDGRGGADTINGSGGYDTFLYRSGYGPLTINNATTKGTAANGEIDFGAGLTEKDLWFANVSGNLVVTVIGSKDSVTVTGWFGTNPSAAVLNIVGYDNMKLTSGVSNLVSAMATYTSNHTGYNPASATQMPTDAALQSAVSAAWHS